MVVLTLQCYVRLSVCRLSVTLCIMARRCVLQQKLLLTAVVCGQIGWHQNEWPSPSSTMPSPLHRGCHVNYCHYIRRWISRKPLEIEAASKGPPVENGLWGIEWSQAAATRASELHISIESSIKATGNSRFEIENFSPPTKNSRKFPLKKMNSFPPIVYM